jgi:hypothetical protein
VAAISPKPLSKPINLTTDIKFQLKDLGVTVFTFGIRNGNVKELRDMASLPTDEHSFILDSFQEFEALARRALHEGRV